MTEKRNIVCVVLCALVVITVICVGVTLLRMPKFALESAKIDSFSYAADQPLSLSFGVTVRFTVDNPNYVDIMIERARIRILYTGKEIGQASAENFVFRKRAKSSFVIGANITQFDPTQALNMNLAYLGEGLKLRFVGPVVVKWATVEFTVRLNELETFHVPQN
eukprot:Phypoly_transcript_23428.p1 GENE.Phypoly_transcript_23428~~Phypoly_transcript_23428.p1  ORF type:complete len:164 (+),score=7.04 Phypoly_transcript_23428:53-544(+)